MLSFYTYVHDKKIEKVSENAASILVSAIAISMDRREGPRRHVWYFFFYASQH